MKSVEMIQKFQNMLQSTKAGAKAFKVIEKNIKNS